MGLDIAFRAALAAAAVALDRKLRKETTTTYRWAILAVRHKSAVLESTFGWKPSLTAYSVRGGCTVAAKDSSELRESRGVFNDGDQRRFMD